MSDREKDSEIQVTEVNKNPDAPLVVDLPDGQKLMVGQLPPGTVVEIATWRGTSRPDSRTTRLLLGVSGGTEEEPDAPVEVAPIQPISRRKRREQKNMIRKYAQRIALTVIALGILIGAFVASPLQIVKPTLGSSIGFGSAGSALVVANPSTDYAKGDAVVAYLGEGKEQVIFGSFDQTADDSVLIQTSGGFAQTSSNSLIGKVLFVIPFLGKLF